MKNLQLEFMQYKAFGSKGYRHLIFIDFRGLLYIFWSCALTSLRKKCTSLSAGSRNASSEKCTPAGSFRLRFPAGVYVDFFLR